MAKIFSDFPENQLAKFHVFRSLPDIRPALGTVLEVARTAPPRQRVHSAVCTRPAANRTRLAGDEKPLFRP